MRRTRVGLAVLAATALGSLAAFTGAPASAATKPAFTFRHNHLPPNNSYGEPSLAVTNKGKIIVCTPGGPGTNVWYSSDDGHTFGKTNTSSFNGGGDCELDALPNGDILNADLEVYASNVHISHDSGKTWSTVATPNSPYNSQDPGAVGLEQDRQWFAHTPDGKNVFLVYHDFVAEAEFYASSSDGGKTWDYTNAATPVTGADQASAPGAAKTPAQGDSASLVDQGVNTFSGPMLVSPDGKDLYVVYSISDAQSNVTDGTPPFGHSKGIIVAHKGPEDSAFTNKYAVTSVADETNGAIFSWGTVDAAGNVYVLYNSDKGSPGHFHTYYVYSTDKAKTWSAPIKVDGDPLNTGVHIYATGAAGAPGVLDMAWYESNNATSSADNSALWHAQFAQIRGANTSKPTITRAQLSDDPIHKGNICLNGLLCVLGGDRSLADFFELAIGPDGMAQVAYADNYEAHTGKGEVVWAKQTSGASAYSTKVTGGKTTGSGSTKGKGSTAGSGSGGLPTTGLASVVPIAALALLAGAAVLRRRRSA